MQKKILFLGGSFFQMSPVLYAKKQGHYVITCDYLPDNPAHQYADEYHNVSTTDIEGVLQLAKRLKIDGIVAYASDPSAPTAAYVANKLNLPGNPYDSVVLLTRKDLFRDFLRANHFNAPVSASFSSLEPAREYFRMLNGPAMVKPVDSSGSKGVSRISRSEQLPAAFEYALSFSRIKKVIIEAYIERKGCQIAGDGFVLDGRLVFRCFAQEHFNATGNPFVPVGESFPLQLPEALQHKIHLEIERLMLLLQMKVGALNFDIVISHQDEIYLMEVGPRGGGNFITEVINYSTGVDLAKYVTDAALGSNCSNLDMYTKAGCYSSYIIHSNKNGVFNGLHIDTSVSDNVIKKSVFVKEGMPVHAYAHSGHSLGCLIFRFDSAVEMLEKMETMHHCVYVKHV